MSGHESLEVSLCSGLVRSDGGWDELGEQPMLMQLKNRREISRFELS